MDMRVAMLPSARDTDQERSRIHLCESHILWAQHNEGENKKGCRLVETQHISNLVQWYVSENLLEIGEQK